MTYEIQAEALCDHRVHRNGIYFSPNGLTDYRSLYLSEVLSTDNDLRLWYNDIEILQNDPNFGWKLEYNEYSEITDQLKKIVFKRPIKDFFGVFEVSYTVRPEKCRKCFGNLILYDHSFNRNGQVLFCTFEQKLIQQIIKLLFTELGSNPFLPWYGTTIPSSIYQAIRNPSAVKRNLLTDVTLALDKIRNIHFHQSKIQYLHPREIFETINNIDVVQDSMDPRIFYITVECSTLAGDNILIKRELLLGELFNNLPIRAAGIN